MKCHSFCSGAITAMVGVVVGAASVMYGQYASAYVKVGAPYSDAAQEMRNHRSAPQVDVSDYQRLMHGQMPVQGDATVPTYWDDGVVEEGVEIDIDHCMVFSGTRRTHCIVNAVNGEGYQQGQTRNQ